MKSRIIKSVIATFLFGASAGLQALGIALNDPQAAVSAGPEIQSDSSSASIRSQLGLEIGALSFSGADIQIYYRKNESPWLVGYKYAKWTETFEFFGIETDTTKTTMAGPFVRYLLKPYQNKTWYLGASMLKHSVELTCLTVPGTDKDSDTSPYFGAGVMGKRDRSVYYNIGLLLSPTAELSTLAGGCAMEQEGGVDLNAHIGIVF